jgi:hypothetical protein
MQDPERPEAWRDDEEAAEAECDGGPQPEIRISSKRKPRAAMEPPMGLEVQSPSARELAST